MLKIIQAQNYRFLVSCYWSWISYTLQPFMEFVIQSLHACFTQKYTHYNAVPCKAEKWWHVIVFCKDLFSVLWIYVSLFIPSVHVAVFPHKCQLSTKLGNYLFTAPLIFNSMFSGQRWSKCTVLHPSYS